MTPPVRVLVVDDSALMRKLIPQILASDSSIQVVGTAMDGNFGLKKIEEMKPQVVTLDLEMPGMGGLDMLKEIMRGHRLPVIVVSSHSTQGASVTLQGAVHGSVRFRRQAERCLRPHAGNRARTDLPRSKPPPRAGGTRVSAPATLPSKPVAESGARRKTRPTRVVAIGVSTGGPQALQYLLPQLPKDFPGTILVVQHMPEGFTEMFSRRLDEICAIRSRRRSRAILLLAGRALICPGNRHLKVKRTALGDVVVLSDEPRVNGHRPSVDVLFRAWPRSSATRALACS